MTAHAVKKGEANKESQLFQAIYKDKSRKVVELLEAGVSPNCLNSRGWTPIQEASATGQNLMLVLLFEYGADPYCTKSTGPGPYHIASLSGLRSTETILVARQRIGDDPQDYYINIVSRMIRELKETGRKADAKLLENAAGRNLRRYLRK